MSPQGPTVVCAFSLVDLNQFNYLSFSLEKSSEYVPLYLFDLQPGGT